MKRRKLIVCIGLLLIVVFVIYGIATAQENEIIYSFVLNRYVCLCPSHVAGDREFAGHGPIVHVSAQLFVKVQRELWVRLYLQARETRQDWTEARQTWEFPIWNAPMGYVITYYSPSGPSTAGYIDNNHQIDRPPIGGSSLVRMFEVMGDTGGNDVGNCTPDDVYMNVYFNNVQVKCMRTQF